MFLEESPLLSVNFVQTVDYDGCHGNRNIKFAKSKLKIFFSEAIRRMKLKLSRNVHTISFYKNKICFLLPLLMCVHRHGSKVSIDL